MADTTWLISEIVKWEESYLMFKKYWTLLNIESGSVSFALKSFFPLWTLLHWIFPGWRVACNSLTYKIIALTGLFYFGLPKQWCSETNWSWLWAYMMVWKSQEKGLKNRERWFQKIDEMALWYKYTMLILRKSILFKFR